MDKKVKYSIDEFVRLFRNGLFNSKDIQTQIKAGWFDWHCDDFKLANKTYSIGKILEKIENNGKINTTHWYMWCKNSSPLNGLPYDDYHFADIQTGLVQMTIQIDNYLNPKKYTIWGRLTPKNKYNYSIPLFETNSLDDLLSWLNTPWQK